MPIRRPAPTFNIVNLAGGTEIVSVSYPIFQEAIGTLYTLADGLEMHIRRGTRIVNVTSTGDTTVVYLEEASDDWRRGPYVRPMSEEEKEREWGALRERWVTDDILMLLREDSQDSDQRSCQHSRVCTPVLTVFDSDRPPARARIPASNGRSLLETFTRVLQRLLGHEIFVMSVVYTPEAAHIGICSGETRVSGWMEALAPFIDVDAARVTSSA
ncbi:hypothetical protein CC1G_10013 [Coprinopsis cinerea okayama7|uniref:Uncharacterized protein n=1 Tax=Coprinopsis cinerea (strain Okayama-7 / 130 / ATCC MYA-4618 / FGSC 9003) TaxID=240176 RepID=A8NDL1_COPC7|nr:hypothetical protein CC1G_10013 [Coprinopsis cinerea okayama7\|eukprot:XP_001832799.2 hypothetical protein CC1G_10013 [Coprinopsis cinerea okayama7\